MTAPHPSFAGPHCTSSWAQVLGAQMQVPGVPPQVSGGVQPTQVPLPSQVPHATLAQAVPAASGG
jgi:hypothetical protein